jgi:hypothetical protein
MISSIPRASIVGSLTGSTSAESLCADSHPPPGKRRPYSQRGREAPGHTYQPRSPSRLRRGSKHFVECATSESPFLCDDLNFGAIPTISFTGVSLSAGHRRRRTATNNAPANVITTGPADMTSQYHAPYQGRDHPAHFRREQSSCIRATPQTADDGRVTHGPSPLFLEMLQGDFAVL